MTYEYCAKMGMTQAQVAKSMNVSRQAVSAYARLNNLKFVKVPQRGIPYKEFESRSEAGRAEGVSPQAVSQRVWREDKKTKEG